MTDGPIAAWLRVLSGPQAGDVVRIARPRCRLGSRLDLEVPVGDPEAPPIACVIETAPGKYPVLTVIDGHGVTYENGPLERSGMRAELIDNEVIGVGRVELGYSPLQRWLVDAHLPAGLPSGCELAASQARLPRPPGATVLASLLALDGPRMGWDVPLAESSATDGLPTTCPVEPLVLMDELGTSRFERSSDQDFLVIEAGRQTLLDDSVVVTLGGVRWAFRRFW